VLTVCEGIKHLPVHSSSFFVVSVDDFLQPGYVPCNQQRSTNNDRLTWTLIGVVGGLGCTSPGHCGEQQQDGSHKLLP
jgi:hypothetical protein